ncbi:MAG: tetraacyldisaccharide 4'-kinase [Steroidobacteraceae bacterium]|nr:tetraacyldisaccharide 4'-kinase [Steroidobacteraceae bacterium]
MSFDAALQRLWYGPRWISLPLWPLGWLFGALVALRRFLYRIGVLRARQVAVPVVVVGNITVGGTGKTPVAAWLARQLGLRGRRVGVVLRGYGGHASGQVQVVTAGSDPAEVGDEAVLHASRGPHVVVIGADRVAAANRAVAEGAEIIVCDDGLQHLRLARDYEIAVVDAARGLGNGQLLPAGPLRESATRLESVDAVVRTQRGGPGQPTWATRAPLAIDAHFGLGDAINLRSGERRTLDSFRGRTLHAVAGIGHPQAFFDGLQSAGLRIETHALADHAALDPAGLPFPTDATVLMTEKDAVKCRSFAGADWWFVELGVNLERTAASDWVALVLERTGLTGAGVHLG